MYKIINNDSLLALEELEENSIDSIVTDPPYELNFMGKGWDNAGISFNKEIWQKCLRVLKPGGYLLAFGGSRTFHRIAVAIEDSGFEIRDTIMWLYGSGFPKSMSLSKGLEAKEKLGNAGTRNKRKIEQLCNTEEYTLKQTNNGAMGEIIETTRKDYIPNTELAKHWQGWGTCLKPSFEPIIVARKPFKGSLVDNVIKYGVGGINIDECRVESNGEKISVAKDFQDNNYSSQFGNENFRFKQVNTELKEQGRFPANTILTYDETDFKEVCGGFPVGGKNGSISKRYKINNQVYSDYGYCNTWNAYNDSGSASRYFMNCKYTGKDEEIWKQLLVNNVENNLEILKATKDNIAQMNVEDLLKELKDHYAKYVENQQDLIETSIVQDIVKILTWDFKIETSQVIQDFITNSKKCIQFLNLVQFVEKMDNIDTTQITQNLLKLFGYVKVVITNYIQGNIEYDQKRYIYTPKASKKDRDEGLDDFEEKTAGELTERKEGSAGITAFTGSRVPKRNSHPTVKPTELMQYLVRLVTPKGGTILDPFMGSGSTGKAVMFENKERNADYSFIGIEREKEYCDIAEARISFASKYEIPKEEKNQISFTDLLNG